MEMAFKEESDASVNVKCSQFDLLHLQRPHSLNGNHCECNFDVLTEFPLKESPGVEWCGSNSAVMAESLTNFSN